LGVPERVTKRHIRNGRYISERKMKTRDSSAVHVTFFLI